MSSLSNRSTLVHISCHIPVYLQKNQNILSPIITNALKQKFYCILFFGKLQIFIDKESVTNALTASNDAHLLKIDEFADEINEKAKKWIKETITSIYSGEKYDRNRARVMEINHFIDALRNDVENLDIPALGES